jgi:hypothetical protein
LHAEFADPPRPLLYPTRLGKLLTVYCLPYPGQKIGKNFILPSISTSSSGSRAKQLGLNASQFRSEFIDGLAATEAGGAFTLDLGQPLDQKPQSLKRVLIGIDVRHDG